MEEVSLTIDEAKLKKMGKTSKEPGKPKEEVYSNSKIIQVIKTYWKLGHEHKFITKIVARRANECIVSITEPDYKNINKNDIEDMYLLIMNGKVPDYEGFKGSYLDLLEELVTKKVIYHLFDDEVEFYREMITSQLQVLPKRTVETVSAVIELNTAKQHYVMLLIAVTTVSLIFEVTTVSIRNVSAASVKSN
ncbi:hypothetical protein Tco_1079829 [Tanacetum coccineum]|uniref:Uncharacterized protein n=1 Tax=Tanacetum coccineum TaxID=301880 RepID=A0ABQ5HT59_9ASTR